MPIVLKYPGEMDWVWTVGAGSGRSLGQAGDRECAGHAGVQAAERKGGGADAVHMGEVLASAIDEVDSVLRIAVLGFDQHDRGDIKPARLITPIHALIGEGAAHQQPCSDEQDEAGWGFGNDQDPAQSQPASAFARASAAILQDPVQVDPGALQRGHEAEPKAGQDDDSASERQGRTVDGQAGAGRQIGG